MYTINGVDYAIKKKEVAGVLGITPHWARTLIERGMPRKSIFYKGREIEVYPVPEIKSWYAMRAQPNRPKRKRVVSHQGMTYTPATLCWDCQRAAGADRCCWAARFEPVPGWTAVEGRTMKGLITYAVKACPAFLRDKKR